MREAVRRELNPVVLESCLEVGKERVAIRKRALADEPRRDELRVAVDRGPGPHVAVVGVVLFAIRNILGLRADEAPNLVALDDIAGQIAENRVLVLGTSLADVFEQVRDGLTGYSGRPGDRSHAHALAEQTDHLRPALGGEPVHTEQIT